MARPVTMFTGQWADLPLAELARKCSEFGYDGLELACWGDHFEVDKALPEDGYCARNASCSKPTGCKSSPSAPTWPARPCWTISTPGTSPSCRRTSGATAIRRSQRPCRRGAEGHGPGGPEARRGHCQRLHRLEHLAAAVFLPAGAGRDDRRRLQAARRAIQPDPRRFRRVRREVRPGGPSHRNRLRPLHRPSGRWRRSNTARSSASISTPATCSGRASIRWSSCASSPTASSTST